MTLEKKVVRLAVVGFGPRGLGAIEALATKSEESRHHIQIDIFDPVEHPGAGPNFDPDQSDECILNIPIRLLDIDPPDLVSQHIQAFSDWSAKAYEPNDFPPRSDVGAYLNARFKAVCDATAGRFDVIRYRSRVTHLKTSDDGWFLQAGKSEFGPYAEVLLTQGQPETAPDEQLERWGAYANTHDLDLINAYPASDLLNAAQDWTDKTVAIRGLGLSTFDVVRLLTKGLGGTFLDGEYRASGKEPRAILPFSLTGLPPAAKPATQEIDDHFNTTDEETCAFEDALARATALTPKVAIQTIYDALIAPILRISSDCSGSLSSGDVRRWFEVERDSPGAQDTRDTVEAFKSDIDMAHGRIPPSIGYIVGQIWRKWQNIIRQGFNPITIQADTATAIIAFDEGLKRFSYGPPVSASEEMLILIEQGLVCVSVVDDPDILLEHDGWRISDRDDEVFASVMIDAVLPSPDLDAITDPLVSSCISNNHMHAFADGFGASTISNGELYGMGSDGLCMLGRLTLGSVIAVDSLHDCFGASTKRWADGVIARILEAQA